MNLDGLHFIAVNMSELATGPQNFAWQNFFREHAGAIACLFELDFWQRVLY